MTRHKGNLPWPGKMLLWLFLDDEDYYQAAGDYEESYLYRFRRESPARAKLWFWFALFKSLPLFVRNSIYWRGVMFKNHFKTALRIIRKQKLFSFINVVGLAVSLMCCLLILFHVKDELSYEKNYPKVDRIYRAQINSKYGSNFRNWATSAPALGPLMEESFSEVESTARLSAFGELILSYTPDKGLTKRFEEGNGFFADNSFFSLFDVEFISGDSTSALEEPHSVVLTSSLSKKYFGNTDPLGQTLMNESLNQPLLVTGVIRDFPPNTHLKINYLISMPTFPIYMNFPDLFNHRTWKTMYTYVLLRSRQDLESFISKSDEFMTGFLSALPGRVEELQLQPISRIHLHSKLEGEMGPNSDIAYVYIFSGAALLILLIAAVNFINLSTAQSFKRMKEIGVRKVVGARKGQLIKQHLGESLLLIFISTIVALFLLNLFIPVYNQMAGKNLTFSSVMTAGNSILIGLLMGLLALLAGLYPSFFVSGFPPINSIKSVRNPRSAAAVLRKGLVVFQFAISIFMIFCTITFYRQLFFFQHMELGFNKNNLVAVRMNTGLRDKAVQNFDAVKNEILRNPAVQQVAMSSNLFGTTLSNERLTPVGTEDRNALPMLRFMRVDDNFLETTGLTLLDGRNFNPASDQKGAYIICESVAQALNLEQPLGLQCLSDVHDGEAPIVGVIKDFHFASLHSPIEPLVLEYRPDWTGYLLVRYQGDDVRELLGYLDATLEKISPGNLFSYEFIDDFFNRNYSMENRALEIFKAFSLLALFVACLGLFGLTVYSAEVRIKEIGIRKVLGASGSNIIVLLSKEFVIWVLLANILAWPLAFIAMNRWLQNFAYRTHINVWTFFLSAALAVLIAMTTTGFQAIRSAVSNPVDSLRYE